MAGYGDPARRAELTDALRGVPDDVAHVWRRAAATAATWPRSSRGRRAAAGHKARGARGARPVDKTRAEAGGDDLTDEDIVAHAGWGPARWAPPGTARA